MIKIKTNRNQSKNRVGNKREKTNSLFIYNEGDAIEAK
jgi:hypothetical protein